MRADEPQERRSEKVIYMATINVNSPIVLKARELCQTLLDQPQFADIQKRIAAFQKDSLVQAQFKHLSERRQQLEQKQEQGGTITQAEIAEFEKLRDGFVNHPIASAFLAAQEEMHEMRRVVNAYITNTFESGKLAAPEEIIEASCGHQCGCHDHEH